MALSELFRKILCTELNDSVEGQGWFVLALTLTSASLPSLALSMCGSCPIAYHPWDAPDPLYAGNDEVYVFIPPILWDSPWLPCLKVGSPGSPYLNLMCLYLR